MARNRGTAYQTLASDLRTSILQGKYADGSALPTEAELSAQHQLSRQTVRRAFQELVAEDLVYRVAGRGTFVVPADRQYLRQHGSIEELMGLSLDTELELIDPLGARVASLPRRPDPWTRIRRMKTTATKRPGRASSGSRTTSAGLPAKLTSANESDSF